MFNYDLHSSCELLFLNLYKYTITYLHSYVEGTFVVDILFSHIEDVIWEDPGERGFITFALRGELEQAAVSLLTANHVLIVTGFYIEKRQTGETDGPPGAVFLASALKKLGIKVTLLTNVFNAEILNCAMEELNLNCPIIVVQKGNERTVFPQLLKDEKLTHVVAIEQMGSAMDGKYYSMRGEDLSYHTACFDSLFHMAREKGVTTIGVGDGGNEIGMGKLFPIISTKEDISWKSCVTSTEFLIIAGVSNWGAYGLIAGLSLYTGCSLLHTPEQEEKVLHAVISAGAVDGRTFESSLSVDAIPITEQKLILAKLHHILDEWKRMKKKALEV
jgi:hypothetical protein